MTERPLLRESMDAGVLRLELSAPASRNALSLRLLSTLRDAIAGVTAEVAGIVITGGPQIFSAGADFHDITGTSADLAYDDAVATVVEAIRQSECVVVAAIEGPCLGAAADLALSCDFRVFAEGAYIQIPAVRLGLLYNPVAIDRLRALYPHDSVARLLLLGERFTATEALTAGFASRRVPHGEAMTEACAMLTRLPPEQRLARVATKRVLQEPAGLTRDAERLQKWQKMRVSLLDSEVRAMTVAAARRRHVDKSK